MTSLNLHFNAMQKTDQNINLLFIANPLPATFESQICELYPRASSFVSCCRCAARIKQEVAAAGRQTEQRLNERPLLVILQKHTVGV